MKIENEIRINTHNKKMNKNRGFLNKNELEYNMLGWVTSTCHPSGSWSMEGSMSFRLDRK